MYVDKIVLSYRLLLLKIIHTNTRMYNVFVRKKNSSFIRNKNKKLL